MASFIVAADGEARVTVADGAGLGHFGLRPGVLGASLRVAFASWPDIVSAFERAIAGQASRTCAEASGATFVVRSRPRDEQRPGDGALLFAEVEEGTLDDALAVSEARLADAQRLAHVGSWEWDVRGDRVHWTDELYRIYGLEPSSFGGSYRAFLERVLPVDRERTEHMVRTALESGEPFDYDHRVVRPDGSVRVLHTRGGVITDGTGAVRRLIGACWDVTELRQASAEREHALSLLEATLESTVDALLVVDRQDRVTAYNRRLLELWGLGPEPLTGVSFEALLVTADAQLDPASAEACMRRVRALQADPAAESFDSLAFKDGRFLERYSRPQRIGDEIVGRVWSYRDVTARERSLREAQRALAIRDEFLSVVAHEIRGPLTSLHLAAQGLRRGAPPAIQERLYGIIDREGRRVARFIEGLVDVIGIRGGQLRFVFTTVDLTEVARAVVAEAAPDAMRAGSRVELVEGGPVVGCWVATVSSRLSSTWSRTRSSSVAGGPSRS